MLLRVVREKEVAYYNSSQIKAIKVSRVYEDDGQYDVSFDMYDGNEPIRVFNNQVEAEEFVRRLAALLHEDYGQLVVDCDTL